MRQEPMRQERPHHTTRRRVVALLSVVAVVSSLLLTGTSAAQPPRPAITVHLTGEIGAGEGTFVLSGDGLSDAGDWSTTSFFLTGSPGTLLTTAHATVELVGDGGTIWGITNVVLRPGNTFFGLVEDGRFTIRDGDGDYRGLRAAGNHFGTLDLSSDRLDTTWDGFITALPST